MDWTLAIVGGIVCGLTFWLTRNQFYLKNLAQQQVWALEKSSLEQELVLKNNKILELTGDLQEKQQQLEQSSLNLNQARIDLTHLSATYENEKQTLQEKLALIQETESKVVTVFKGIAAEALKTNNQIFLDLANSNFEKLQIQAQGALDQRQQAISGHISPLRKFLESVDQKINSLDKARAGNYSGLTEQIKALMASQYKLEKETHHLNQALHSPNVRGQWGEMQLRKTVELAGMVPHVDFIEQLSSTTEYSIQRPDMVIRLPNRRNIVIDAKAPVNAYRATKMSPMIHPQSLKRHARLLREHIQKLGSKRYWRQFSPTPEFVVLFLPSESIFSTALQNDPGVIEYSSQQQVILAAPTTLIALLKTVAYGWKQEEINRDAKIISEFGHTLYERLHVLASHIAEMRRGIDRAVGAYNKTVNSLETRLLPTARKFQHIFNSNGQEFAPLSSIDRNLAVPKAEEMRINS